MKDPKYKFLGMYGESPDITGGMGGEGVDAFAKFLDAGGTLVTMGNAVALPRRSRARPHRRRVGDHLGELLRAAAARQRRGPAPRSSGVLRLHGQDDADQIHPGPAAAERRPSPIAARVLARYVGGDAAVLSGLMRGADEIRDRPFAIDVAGGFTGKGRVVLFANNPIYRWQNHGEFNMVFNALLNWNDLAAPSSAEAVTGASDERKE